MIVSEAWLGAVNGDQVIQRKQQEQLENLFNFSSPFCKIRIKG
jgi:hypothetical protein